MLPGSTGPDDRTSEDRGTERIVEQEEYGQDPRSELGPDLDLDVPVLQIEELDLEVEDLELHVSLQAQLADFVNIGAGVSARLGKVKLSMGGVEARVSLRVKLEGTLETLRRALDTIDANPRVLGGEAGRDAGRPADSSSDTEARKRDTAERPEEGDAFAGIKATDAARRKAEELGVDLSRIEGTGSGGRIILGDVKKAAG